MATASLGINVRLDAGSAFAGIGRLESSIKGLGGIATKALTAPAAALSTIGTAALGVGAITDAASGLSASWLRKSVP